MRHYVTVMRPTGGATGRWTLLVVNGAYAPLVAQHAAETLAGCAGHRVRGQRQRRQLLFIPRENDLVVLWRWRVDAGEGFKKIVYSVTQ